MLKKVIFVTGLIVVVCSAVSRMPSVPAAAAPQFERRPSQSGPEQEMLDRQVREANKKRQQDIRNDTDKLFQLASELKAAVDKTNENLLSLEVVKKADEVEKLAKRVKEKMRDSIGPPVRNEQPPLVRPPQ